MANLYMSKGNRGKISTQQAFVVACRNRCLSLPTERKLMAENFELMDSYCRNLARSSVQFVLHNSDGMQCIRIF